MKYAAFGLTACLAFAVACSGRVDLLDDGVGGSGGAGGSGVAVGGPGSGQSGSGQSGSGQSGSGQSGSGQSGSGSGQSGSGSSGSGSSGSGQSGSGSSGSGQSGSSGSGQSGSGSSSTGGPVCLAFGACANCISNACPDTWCECAGNSDCGALFACSDGCNGDQACNAGCLAAYPSGISVAVLVGDCAQSYCPAQCPQVGDDLSPCEQCLYEDCDDEMNTCLSQPDCLGLWTCFGNCGNIDLTCQSNCYATYPAGIAPLQDVLTCADNSCDSTCSG